MNKTHLLKIMTMMMALYLVIYAMRELRQPPKVMRANGSNPIFLLFGNNNK